MNDTSKFGTPPDDPGTAARRARDVLDDIDDTVAEITDDEIADRLRETLHRGGYPRPGMQEPLAGNPGQTGSEEAARIITSAKQDAADIITDAKREATRIRDEALTLAAAIVGSAREQASRIRSDAGDGEAFIPAARTYPGLIPHQGRDHEADRRPA